MIKIVFLIRSLDRGGAENQLVELAKKLSREQFDVTVISYYSGGPLKRILDEAGIRVVSLAKKGRWDMLRFLWRLVAQIHQLQPHVLHGYLGTSNLLSVFLKVLFPNTRIVWGIRASNMDLACYNWLLKLTFRIECFLSRFANLIIVNSYAGCDYYLVCGFSGEKMVVIPNGIDSERFYPYYEARKKVRAEWGVTENENLIGLIARLDPMKDHPTFLKAAAMLAQVREDVRFVCVGNGPESYKQQLHYFANKLGLKSRLIWAGERDDMPAVNNAFDIISSSSSFGEGFPNVIGEAMSCGIPCVVTDVGDSAKIVGDAGIVVPFRNPRVLAEAWRKLLRNPAKRKKMGVDARETITKHFGVEMMVKRHEKIYRNLHTQLAKKTNL